MTLTINTSVMKRVVVIELVGRVDSTNAQELRLELEQQIDFGNTNQVLDCSLVEYMSNAGLVVLVSILKQVKRNGGDLRIANPSDRVKEVMGLAGLDTIFKIYPTQVEAVGSF